MNQRSVMRKGFCQTVLDFVFALLRFCGVSESSSVLQKLDLTTLEEERVRAIAPYVEGRLLDIGCGRNMLVKMHKAERGDGVGVGVYDYGGGAAIVEDSSNLPFQDGAFDTVVFAACLNHIPYRLETLREAHRVIGRDGRLIITMINPVIGFLVHKIWEVQKRGLDVERGMKKGEAYGLWSSDVLALSEEAGFRMLHHKRFDYGLNHIYVMKKATRSQG